MLWTFQKHKTEVIVPVYISSLDSETHKFWTCCNCRLVYDRKQGRNY